MTKRAKRVFPGRWKATAVNTGTMVSRGHISPNSPYFDTTSYRKRASIAHDSIDPRTGQAHKDLPSAIAYSQERRNNIDAVRVMRQDTDFCQHYATFARVLLADGITHKLWRYASANEYVYVKEMKPHGMMLYSIMYVGKDRAEFVRQNNDITYIGTIEIKE